MLSDKDLPVDHRSLQVYATDEILRGPYREATEESAARIHQRATQLQSFDVRYKQFPAATQKEMVGTARREESSGEIWNYRIQHGIRDSSERYQLSRGESHVEIVVILLLQRCRDPSENRCQDLMFGCQMVKKEK